jgi:transposase
MPQSNDMSRSLAALGENDTLIAVIEMSQSSWLVAAIVPGVERHPAKKLEPSEAGRLRRLHRWREEAREAGRTIDRIAVAFEAGRDGFWLARWLRTHGIEAGACPGEGRGDPPEQQRRLARTSPVKTDRLDTGLLKRSFLGWLRGEREHRSMAAMSNDIRN